MAVSKKRVAVDEPDVLRAKKARLSPGDSTPMDESTPQSTIFTEQQSETADSATSHATSKRPKIYICDQEGCDKAFDRPVRLEAHQRTHTNDRPFACKEDDCDKRFFKNEHLKAHVRDKHSHNDQQNHVCGYVITVDEEGQESTCGKSFTTATRLKRHIAAHEKKEELKCQEVGCGQTFRKMETLQRHIKKDHLLEDSFTCGIITELNGFEETCDETFPTVGQLKVHEKKVHAGNRHFCTLCPPSDSSKAQSVIGFPTYNDLQAHIKLHHPPTCTTCGKVCKSNRDLTAHIDIEHSTLSSRQVYACEYPGCDRSFTRKGNLNVHVQSVHIKARNFVCGQTDLGQYNVKVPGWANGEGRGCGSKFGTKANLEEHVRTRHLDLPSLIKRKPRDKVKKEPSDMATPLSAMDLDEPSELNDRMFDEGENASLSLLTGHGYDDNRHISCWVSGCIVRFQREFDLVQHLQLTHGRSMEEIYDRLSKPEALTGDKFWLGGLDGEPEGEREGADSGAATGGAAAEGPKSAEWDDEWGDDDSMQDYMLREQLDDTPIMVANDMFSRNNQPSPGAHVYQFENEMMKLMKENEHMMVDPALAGL